METTAALQSAALIERLQHAPSALDQAFPNEVALAREALTHLDYPTTRMEGWKYTRTTRISSSDWSIQPASKIQPDLSDYTIEGLEAVNLIFVNGFYRPDLSSVKNIPGISILPLSTASGFPRHQEEITQDFFSALHESFCTDGLLIRASQKSKVNESIHIIFIQEGQATLAQPHILLQTEEAAELNTVVSFVSTTGSKSFCNAAIEGHAAANSRLECTLVQRENPGTSLICRSLFSAERDATLSIHTHTINGDWVRNDLHLRLNGSNIQAFLNGTYLPRDTQHIDNHTLVDHRFPHCESNELYKGVLDGRGRAVFNGKVYVRTDAQKTNAYQTNANIMLSDEASVNTKPELEIYADDVKCSHGSTTGQLDEGAVFYLQSRGIGQDNARRLLTTAFIHAVLSRITDQSIKSHIIKLLQRENLLLD